MRFLIPFLALAVSACGGGGGGGGSNTPAVPPPVTVQSPGGHWFVLDADSNPFHLYASEAGEVRAIFYVTSVTDGPTFGTGSVSVMGGDTIAGTLQARGIQASAGSPPPVDLSCNLAGTVRQRQTLSLQVTCSDNNGIVLDESYEMTPQPGYDAGSSLDDIAGNYTLAFRPASNMLNITADGTVFGMYHNGANCTVNGIVSILDASHSLLGAEWTMSNCIDPFGIYEGAFLSGFAMPGPDPNDPQGSYYFILVGENLDGLFAVSVTYEPT